MPRPLLSAAQERRLPHEVQSGTALERPLRTWHEVELWG